MNFFARFFKRRKAIINFIDLDNDNHLLLTSGVITGIEGKPIVYDVHAQINKLLAKGYSLKRNDFVNSPVFGNDKEKTYNVAFSHDPVVVDSDHLNYGFNKHDVERDIEQTVHYVGQGAQMPPDNISTAVFKRSLVVDTVTKEAIKAGAWLPAKQNALLISTPTIPGFVPDKVVVGGKAVNPDSKDEKLEVKYHVNEQPSTNEQHATIEFVDWSNNNNIIKKFDLKGHPSAPIKYDANTEIKHLEAEGYRLINNSFNPDKKMEFFGTDDSYVPTFVITLKKILVAVNSTHPNAIVDPSEYQKSYNWTVKYEGAGKQTPDAKTQKLAWERTVTLDQESRKVEPKGRFTTPWHTKGQYENVKVPVVNGYHTYVKVVEPGKPQMSNQTQAVVYRPNGRIIPVDQNGKAIVNATEPRFVTDPADPTKAQADQIVPDVAGYTHDKMTITPTDPSKDFQVQYKQKAKNDVLMINTGRHGQAVQPIPAQKEQAAPTVPEPKQPVPDASAPDKSRDINTKSSKQQVAYINFIDLDHHGKQLTSSGPLVGTVGESINDLYDTEIPIKALHRAGYDVVFNSFDDQGKIQKFESNNLMSQIFTIGVRVHHEEKEVVHKQTAYVNYIDVDNNDMQVTSSGPLRGNPGDNINDLYSTERPLKNLEDAGYELVFNGFDPKGIVQRFDNNMKITQIFTVGLRRKK